MYYENYKVLREYKRRKRNRRRLEIVGTTLLGFGLSMLIIISGRDSSYPFMQTILMASGACGLSSIGVFLLNMYDVLSKDYPLKLKLVAKGDNLCYTLSTKKQKESE